MSKLSAALLLLAGLLAGTARGDVVYLENGEVFEDVVAAEEDGRVRLRTAIGELELPASAVTRIVPSDGGLRGYLRRRAALDPTRPADAAGWLELARWARRSGLEHGHRESSLAAADLDPGLEGLAGEMHRLGYRLDPETGRWRPRPSPRPSMARPAVAGPPPPAEAVRESRRAPRDAGEVEGALARTLEILARAELERASSRFEPRVIVAPAPLPVVPLLAVGFAGFVAEPVPASGADGSAAEGAGYSAPRVPGSLLGTAPARQPGSLLPPRRRGSR